MDGKVRTGSIFMHYGATNPKARYYQDFEFEGKINLINYRVDDWKILGKNAFVISNKLASSFFNPTQINLSWTLKGDFDLINKNDNKKT